MSHLSNVLLKNFFVNTVSICAILTGISLAQAQDAHLPGSINSNVIGGSRDKQFNAQAGILLPVKRQPTSFYFTTVTGGLFDVTDEKNPAGSLGFGYRQLLGSWMMGGLGNFNGHYTENKNWFFSATVGAEFVHQSGFSIRPNVYIPLFDHKKSTGQTSNTGPILVDKPGQPGSCSPNNTPSNRICDLVIDRQLAGQERSGIGFDVKIAYRLPLFKETDVSLFVDPYMYKRSGRDQRGIIGGVDMIVPVSSVVSLNFTAQAHQDRDHHNPEALFGFGIAIRFGDLAKQTTSYLEREISRAPNHLWMGAPLSEKQGGTERQGVIWQENTSGEAVSEVRFVDQRNQNDLGQVVKSTARSGIVIVSGEKGNVDFGDTASMNADHVGVVGGGSELLLKAARDQSNYSFFAPGTRPFIHSTNNEKAVFESNGYRNPIYYNLDIDAGYNAIHVANGREARILNVQASNANANGLWLENANDAILKGVTVDHTESDGIHFDKSSNVSLQNIIIKNTGDDGIELNGSEGANLNNINVDTANGDGVYFLHSGKGHLTNVEVKGSGNNGLLFQNSENISLQYIDVKGVMGDGILFVNSAHGLIEDVKVDDTGRDSVDLIGSDNSVLRRAILTNSKEDGIVVDASDHVLLEDIQVSGPASKKMWQAGVRVQHGSLDAQFHNVGVSGWHTGYWLHPNVTVQDMGGNTIQNKTRTCETGMHTQDGSSLKIWDYDSSGWNICK